MNENVMEAGWGLLVVGCWWVVGCGLLLYDYLGRVLAGGN